MNPSDQHCHTLYLPINTATSTFPYLDGYQELLLEPYIQVVEDPSLRHQKTTPYQRSSIPSSLLSNFPFQFPTAIGVSLFSQSPQFRLTSSLS